MHTNGYAVREATGKVRNQCNEFALQVRQKRRGWSCSRRTAAGRGAEVGRPL